MKSPWNGWKAILEGDTLFTEFKGALTEQFACQEMKLLENTEIAYWANDGATAEIDFLLQLDNKIIPVEVKAATNLKAKSLKVYREKFHPQIEIRTSLADYGKAGTCRRGSNGPGPKVRSFPSVTLIDIPLYAIGALREIIDESTTSP